MLKKQSISRRIPLSVRKRIKKWLTRSSDRQASVRLEKQGFKIGPNDRRKAYEYAVEVLGARRHVDGLLLYTAVRGKFLEGWVPQSYYSSQVKRPQFPYAGLSDFACLNSCLFNVFSTLDIAYIIKGSIFKLDPKTGALQLVTGKLFDQTSVWVIKSDQSRRGTGVHLLDNSKGWVQQSDLPVRNGVIQRFVKQHESLAEISGQAVATLRITTCADQTGNVSVRGSHFRIGRAGEKIIRSAAQMKLAVSPDSNEIDSVGFSTDWERFNHHPDTGVSFKSVAVPAIDRALEIARCMHSKVPYISCIGWDFTIDDSSEPVFLEWNAGNNDIRFTEAVQGPAFRDLNWTSPVFDRKRNDNGVKTGLAR